VVTEAVRRSKAAIGISPDTQVEARLSRLELHEAGSALEVSGWAPALCGLVETCGFA